MDYNRVPEEIASSPGLDFLYENYFGTILVSVISYFVAFGYLPLSKLKKKTVL